MQFPGWYYVSYDVPVKAVTLRFLWSTRKLEPFVQRVFLCCKKIGFLMYFTVFWLYYKTVESSQLSFELYWVEYIRIYYCVSINKA